MQRLIPTLAERSAWLKEHVIGGAAQIFSADAQMLATNTPIVTVAETNGPSTNPLPIPYGNGKVKVTAIAQIGTGTGVTAVQVRIRRNINAENVVVGFVNNVAAAASAQIAVPVEFTDQVGDGRSVQYTVTVQQVGATGNGTISAGTTIDAMVMSG